MKDLKKRGQVTIFIIVGIVILIIGSFFFMWQKQLAFFNPEIVIPTEVAPVKNFIDDCVFITSDEAIRLLGANGGFIRFPAEIELNPKAHISTNPIFPEIKTPLWRYGGQTRIPTEAKMVADLEYYIEENLNNCLEDLDAFQGIFEITKGESKVNVELLDDSVSVELTYPLEIVQVQKNQTTRINKFASTVPIRLKSMYELANKIMEEENIDLFIEETTIDLISLDKDIPYTDIEFTCTPKVWYVEEVRNKLKRLLRTDLPLIRVEKTNYQSVPLDRPYESTHYIWEVTSLKYPTTHVSFSYDEKWDMDMNIRPNNGPILKSNAKQGQDLLNFFCMHIWHFTYDVQFPFMVSIYDEAAKGHDDFNFNFGIQASIDHNQPDTANKGFVPFDFEQTEDSERFCKESSQTLMTVHTFENVSTEDDSEFVEEIEGVNITYTCLRLKCDMGQSEWSFGGAIAALNTEFPYCVNGVLRGTKEGYEDNYIFVTTNEEKVVELFLRPIISKKSSVVKHYEYSLGTPEPLKETENAIITLKRHNETYSSIVYPAIEGVPDLKYLAKGDFKYDLEIYLVSDDGIIGGYIGEWTPDWSQLKDANEVIFHTYYWPYTGNEEDQFTLMSELKNYSKKIPPPTIR